MPISKEEFQIDYSIQRELEEAINLAMHYCEEHIPTADSWSREKLEMQLDTLTNLQSRIGKSFVAGYFR
jgi:hypothetical protein